QSIALQRPLRLLWRDGDRIQIGPTVVRGAGYQLTGDVALEGFYHLRPPRAGAARSGPLGQVTIALRKVSVHGMDPIDADLQATVDGGRASARIDARLAAPRAGA